LKYDGVKIINAIKGIADILISNVLHSFMLISNLKMRTAIILSIAGLCFSGSFSAIQYFPGAQAQMNETSTQPTTEDLSIKMAQLSTSKTPDGIATLAYIWGFPLVTMERQFNYVTSPNVPPMPGRGPANSLSSLSL
jgi:hypothetical protein